MGDPHTPANEDRLQTQGRKDNAAQPLNAADDHGGAERYPPVRQDDAIDPGATSGGPRSFDAPDNPKPRQGAGDGGPPPATNDGRLGPEGDPVEGKR